jgi:hypothetical protein
MPNVERRYSKEEFAKRGDEIYDNEIAPRLKANDKGKFLAIDIETHDFELATDELDACDRLRERLPQAQIWLVRVGSRAVHRFGGRSLRMRP